MKYILLLIPFLLYAKHKHPEKYYQEKWCKANNGIKEYVLPDKTRIDCLLENYAVEVDFAPKWAESIGQSLYYGYSTSKSPAIVIIIEDKERDIRYLNRLFKVTKTLNIKVFTIYN